jgi:ribose-phosphate pyrophosphokinase
MGTPLTPVLRKRFADGECYVQIQQSVRGCDVFLLQPTCSPVHDSLMELMLMVDACRRASARSITVVLPYFGYARADRKSSAREAITAKLVANLLTESGAARVVGLDLHSGQLEGYFDLPVVHMQAGNLLATYIASRTPPGEVVVVSPDVGGVSRARVFAKAINDAPLAIIDKRRTGHNAAQVMNLIGDVAGRHAVLVDDMIDTAGTLQAGAELLHAKGARAVYACASHALLSGPACERLGGGLFTEVVVTNSIPLPAAKLFPQLTVLSVAELLGETISRVYRETSVGSHINASKLAQ